MIRLYTDGSCRDTDDGPVVGWAYVIIDEDGSMIMKDSGSDVRKPDWLSSRNVAGEIMAVINGMDFFEDFIFCEKYHFVDIFHDYEGIRKWIDGTWEPKIDLTITYREYITHLMCRGIDIHFHHVKAHSGDRWNEYVDRLAKEAIGI